jgi:PAS domain S-box-containing protein
MSGGNDSSEQGGKQVQLRDYARTMNVRIDSLRDRARAGSSSMALEEAFQELEVTREELTVADEEITRIAGALAEADQRTAAMLRHYRDLFDAAPDGYAVTDAHGVIREANRTLGVMLGVHPSFLERKPLVNFVVRGDVKAFRSLVLLFARGGGAGQIFRVGFRPRHKQPVFTGEIVTRAVSGVGGYVASVRWAIRKPALSPLEELPAQPQDGAEQ